MSVAMSFARALFAVTLASPLAACGSGYDWRKESFRDQAADRLLFPADTPKARALRAYVVQASLLRLATISPATSSQRAAFYNYNINATDRLSEVLKCIHSGCFYFNSKMIDYEDMLFQMAVAVVDAEAKQSLLRKVASIASGGIADPITAILSVAQAGVRLGRPTAALYHDIQRLRHMIAPNASGNETQVAEAIAANISDYHFLLVYAFIEDSCNGLGLNKAETIKACAKKPNFVSS